MTANGKASWPKTRVNRRRFLTTAAGAGAGLALSGRAFAIAAAPRGDAINLAVIGAGNQGQVLIEQLRKIPGVQFRAVCDIWKDYNLRLVCRRLQAYKYPTKPYEDYREMLASEKDLDAVVVATPDWMHAEHAIACLKAGLHVYCEKEMSNSLEKARQMVLAARETGRLLQIGHQRRSNPRYIHAKDKLLGEAALLGRITNAYAQWNRSVAASGPRGYPQQYAIDDATLHRYGYDSMDHFRDWRFYKKYGGGLLADLGSHQVDIFAWFLGAAPKRVTAFGGNDYWKQYEWYDNVTTFYEFETPAGPVQALYQALSTTSARGYYETFMGTDGTLQISEPAAKCRIYAEGHLITQEGKHPWDVWAAKGYIQRLPDTPKEEAPKEMSAILALYGQSLPPVTYLLNLQWDEPYHKPHLENFIEAVRGKAKLNCPGEVAYETAVQVLRANEAIAAGRPLAFDPAEFKV
jgi:predicted dehydrogenase